MYTIVPMVPPMMVKAPTMAKAAGHPERLIVHVVFLTAFAATWLATAPVAWIISCCIICNLLEFDESIIANDMKTINV